MFSVLKNLVSPEAVGEFHVSLFGDSFAVLENHSGIADLKSECIKVFCNKKILAIFGENLVINELDGYSLKIEGKILSIEYLT